jgi:hypothetical protein
MAMDMSDQQALFSRRRLLQMGASAAVLSALSVKPRSLHGEPAQEQAQAVLQAQASVFAGPSNADFDAIVTLDVGTTVSVAGLYGDFAQVTFDTGAGPQTGYLPAAALDQMPDGVPQLSAGDVPWVLLFQHVLSQPLLFESHSDDYTGQVLFGTAFDNHADTQVDVTLQVQLGDGDIQNTLTGTGVPVASEQKTGLSVVRVPGRSSLPVAANGKMGSCGG